VTRRTARSTSPKLSRLAASVAAVMADCHHANRRLIEIKLNGR
jgi:hypothetical protein